MKETLKPGERAFSLLLLAGNLWELSEALKMCMKKPGLSSYGALPMGLGIIMLLCLCKVILFEDSKKAAPKQEKANRFVSALAYAFPKEIAVFIAMMLVYFAALVLGAGFVISTPVFLFVSMCYLMRKEPLKNAGFTAVLMVLIYVVFKMIFKVTLP